MMLYSEMVTHREGANKRLDPIIYFITISGKPFIVFMKHQWNWQLLWAQLFFHSVMESHNGGT